MKRNIGIDLDGVVADLYTESWPVFVDLYPKKCPKEFCKGSWKNELGLTEDEMTKGFAEVGKRGIYRSVALYPDARRVLVSLSRIYNI